jgi:mRNA-degrading endonuclease RelE of RelBE toxin-antitoxin system
LTSSTKNWTLLVANPAKESLANFPDKDQRRIEQAEGPFGGDIKRLQPAGWRRRVGNYRIFYDLLNEEKRIVVTAIERRTSTTY